MIKSMTGFATLRGASDTYSWSWELRAVNAKGFDLRLRVPDWIEGLEAKLRPTMSRAIQRGSVTLSLRVSREETGADLSLNAAALSGVMAALREVQMRASEAGLALTSPTAADIISLRGVMEQSSFAEDTAPLANALIAELPRLLDDFNEMRSREGAALHQVLTDQLAQVTKLTAEAAALADARKEEAAANLKINLKKVMDNVDGADPDRVAQELAMLAVKSDVTEEIDRLGVHIDAAQALLASDGTVGRKFDFLMQEFNREANTLCSKAQSSALTQVGLALKAVIDQMREQVQNVE